MEEVATQQKAIERSLQLSQEAYATPDPHYARRELENLERNIPTTDQQFSDEFLIYSATKSHKITELENSNSKIKIKDLLDQEDIENIQEVRRVNETARLQAIQELGRRGRASSRDRNPLRYKILIFWDKKSNFQGYGLQLR